MEHEERSWSLWKKRKRKRGRAEAFGEGNRGFWNLKLVATALVVSVGNAALVGENELLYSVTYRDFLPSFCMRPEEYPGFTNDGDADASWVEDAAAMGYGCPGGEFEFLGHPDFEVRYGAFGVTGYSWNLSEAIDSNSINNPPISTIVDRVRGVELASSGLPKPRYCVGLDSNERCGVSSADPVFSITSGSRNFEEWFNDGPRSRRKGQILRVPSISDGVYRFDSDTDSGGFFGPLDEALDESMRGTLFPVTNLEQGLGHKFSFTTEIHTFFEYAGDIDEFEFSGDDDVFVYVNGVLLVDLGGVHGRATTRIVLNDTIAERAQLQIGGIYQFSLFHAERHTLESNFKLTTTLRPGCNVLQSGQLSVDSNVSPAQSIAQFGGIFRTSKPEYILPDGSLVLTTPSDTFTASQIFFTQKQNVGTGFVCEFKYVSEGAASDFAFASFVFILHNRQEGLSNFPFTTGGNLGFKYVSNSIAIVFDGGKEQIRIHHRDVPEEYNGPKVGLRVWENLSWAPGEELSVRVVYYERPNWLEVYVNESLYLREDDLDLQGIIGGRSAYVGFTTGTGSQVVTQRFSDFRMSTVQIDPTRTGFSPSQPLLDSVADGSTPGGVVVVNYDSCNNRIQYGGFPDFIKGVYVQVDQDVRAPARRRVLRGRGLQTDGSARPLVVPANVADNNDGTYAIEIVTTDVAEFRLFAVFGENCTLTVEEDYFPEQDRYVPRVEVIQNDAGTCRFEEYPETIIMMEPASTDPPTLPPFAAKTAMNASALALMIAACVGGFCFLCLVPAVTYYFYHDKKQWDRSKPFANYGREQGQDEAYDDDDEAEKIAARLQKIRQSILREKATKAYMEREMEIESLREEGRDMRAEIMKHRHNLENERVDQQQRRPSIFQKKFGRKVRREFVPKQETLPRNRRSSMASVSSARSTMSSISNAARRFTRGISNTWRRILSGNEEERIEALANLHEVNEVIQEEDEECSDSDGQELEEAPPPPPSTSDDGESHSDLEDEVSSLPPPPAAAEKHTERDDESDDGGNFYDYTETLNTTPFAGDRSTRNYSGSNVSGTSSAPDSMEDDTDLSSTFDDPTSQRSSKRRSSKKQFRRSGDDRS